MNKRCPQLVSLVGMLEEWHINKVIIIMIHCKFDFIIHFNNPLFKWRIENSNQDSIHGCLENSFLETSRSEVWIFETPLNPLYSNVDLINAKISLSIPLTGEIWAIHIKTGSRQGFLWRLLRTVNWNLHIWQPNFHFVFTTFQHYSNEI